MDVSDALIRPDWPAPPAVHAFTTTRKLGDVAAPASAARLRELLPAPPAWLRQVHGVQVRRAEEAVDRPTGDASFTRARNVVCAVMAADCMPVLLAAEGGEAVAAAHAGWRGLCGGVIEAAFAAMAVPPARVLAWLGPAIGPAAYEVGEDVRSAFLSRDPRAEQAFTAGRPGHWMLDLYAVARQRLAACGVTRIYGGGHCTHTERERFFSYRRDRASERMAAFIWIS